MNAAASVVEVRVPDMGNFKDVAVIDVLVKPGDSIAIDTPLVTLESDKATMDVPSTAVGVVEKVHASKGGTVNTGDLIATVRGFRSGVDRTAGYGGAGSADRSLSIRTSGRRRTRAGTRSGSCASAAAPRTRRRVAGCSTRRSAHAPLTPRCADLLSQRPRADR